jgi:O-antigen ligase
VALTLRPARLERLTGAAAAGLLVVTVALTQNRAGIALAGGAPVVAAWLAPWHTPSRRRRWTAIAAAVAVAGTALGIAADRGAGCGCGGELSHGRTGIWRAGIDTAAERPVQGFGAGTFLVASREHQLDENRRPARFAHNLPLEAWVELGLAGLIAVLAWYAACGRLVLTAMRRANPAARLLVPAVAAFPLANLLDWPWELTGVGVLWAVAAGGLLAQCGTLDE